MRVSNTSFLLLICLAVICGLVWSNKTNASNFTIPESKLLSTEFSTKAYGPATVVRSDAPGDAVDFAMGKPGRLQARGPFIEGAGQEYPLDKVLQPHAVAPAGFRRAEPDIG